MTGGFEPPAPYLSVVTVVRNARADLQRTIASVRRQTHRPLQYIVIDGASTDGTLDVIHSSQDVIATWQSEPDNGLYDAMNKGLRAAEGEFLYFLNAGDEFASDDALARIAKAVTDPDCLYYGNVILHESTGKLTWTVPVRIRRRPPARGYRPHHQSVLYPRSFYSEARYQPDLGYRADVHFTDLAWQRCRHHYVDVAIAHSALGGTSSKPICSLRQLRDEFPAETAYARSIARTSGNWRPFLGVTLNVGLKYATSKIGGATMMHRCMYWRHLLRALRG